MNGPVKKQFLFEMRAIWAKIWAFSIFENSFKVYFYVQSALAHAVWFKLPKVASQPIWEVGQGDLKMLNCSLVLAVETPNFHK